MDILNGLFALIVFGALLAVIFMVFREFICWYWKINQSVELLTEIRDLLKAQNATLPPSAIQPLA